MRQVLREEMQEWQAIEAEEEDVLEVPAVFVREAGEPLAGLIQGAEGVDGEDEGVCTVENREGFVSELATGAGEGWV